MLGEPVQIPSHRLHERVPIEGFCTELWAGEWRHAHVLDLSESGLRLQRPLFSARPESLQLEFEIPEVDEIVWASGQVRFDELQRLPRRGRLGEVVRTSGIELTRLTGRHRNMLREFIHDSHQARQLREHAYDLMRAACYRD